MHLHHPQQQHLLPLLLLLLLRQPQLQSRSLHLSQRPQQHKQRHSVRQHCYYYY